MTESSVWKGRRVLVTGHTGFKGGWLALWLSRLGAQVTGFSLEPPTNPNFFTAANVEEYVDSRHGDVRDLEALQAEYRRSQPEVVFHLAAQPLVRASYDNPVTTYMTNVMGTAHVLEAARHSDTVRAAVVVTTDKCYANRETVWSYREYDPLGGHDPYSSSKACAEIVASAYRQSFFSDNPSRIATARAGNVIGGGDWAPDRLIPDCIRALSSGAALQVRNPTAVRPWQHVLEPLQAYLMLAERMLDGTALSGAYNFGPSEHEVWTVGSVVSALVATWGGEASWIDASVPGQAHESHLLKLDSTLARSQLGWKPRLDLKEAIELTVEWYREHLSGTAMDRLTFAQIEAYTQRR
jgi:CDP-glucose 4,6-dehydratase